MKVEKELITPDRFARVVNKGHYFEVDGRDLFFYVRAIERFYDPFEFGELIKQSAGEIADIGAFDFSPRPDEAQPEAGHRDQDSYHHIHLPMPVLDDRVNELAFLASRYIEASSSKEKESFRVIPLSVAGYLDDILIDAGDSNLLHLGMAFSGLYARSDGLFASLLTDEVIPALQGNEDDLATAQALLNSLEHCSKAQPFEFYRLMSLLEKYLHCRFVTGAEGLREWMRLEGCNNKALLDYLKAGIDKAPLVKPTRESVLAFHAIKMKRSKGTLPPLTEEEIEAGIARIKEQEEDRRAYHQKQYDMIQAWMAKGFGPEMLFVEDIPVLPESLRRGDAIWQKAINASYRLVYSRCRRISQLNNMRAPKVVLESEKRTLQLAVDALLYNLLVIENMKANGEI